MPQLHFKNTSFSKWIVSFMVLAVIGLSVNSGGVTPSSIESESVSVAWSHRERSSQQPNIDRSSYFLAPVTGASVAKAPGHLTPRVHSMVEAPSKLESGAISSTQTGAAIDNQRHQIFADIDGRGLAIDGSRIYVHGWGREGSLKFPVSGGVVKSSAERVVVQHDGMHEVISTSALGVRHDMVIEQRPAGTGDLFLDIHCSNGHFESKSSSATELVIRDRRVTYDRLKVIDSTGRELVARMDVVAGNVRIAVQDAEALYPVVVDPTISSVVEQVVYAPWAVGPYSVTYDDNLSTSGAAPGAQVKSDGVNLTLASNSGTLVKTGSVFAGWNTQVNGNGTDYAEGENYTIDAALTLYAKWTLDTYVVAFNANTGTGTLANQTKTFGVDLTLSANTFTKVGSTFSGWTTAADGTGTAYANSATYSGNAAVTLYAQWTVAAFSVTYAANGATGGTVPAIQPKSFGVSIILAGNSGNLVKTGFVFAGWNTAANGSGTPYAAAATYSDDITITLYAQWTVATFSVTYAANGATSGTVPATQTKIYGVALTLANNSGSLVKTGSDFTGWNTAADGSGTAYAAGGTNSTNSTLTLYAQWVVTPITITPGGKDKGKGDGGLCGAGGGIAVLTAMLLFAMRLRFQRKHSTHSCE